MGRQLHAQTQPAHVYVAALYEYVCFHAHAHCSICSIAQIVHNRQLKPWLWPDVLHMVLGDGLKEKRALRVLHDFTNHVRIQ
jgi:hypothetical protein